MAPPKGAICWEGVFKTCCRSQRKNWNDERGLKNWPAGWNRLDGGGKENFKEGGGVWHMGIMHRGERGGHGVGGKIPVATGEA